MYMPYLVGNANHSTISTYATKIAECSTIDQLSAVEREMLNSDITVGEYRTILPYYVSKLEQLTEPSVDITGKETHNEERNTVAAIH